MTPSVPPCVKGPQLSASELHCISPGKVLHSSSQVGAVQWVVVSLCGQIQEPRTSETVRGHLASSPKSHIMSLLPYLWPHSALFFSSATVLLKLDFRKQVGLRAKPEEGCTLCSAVSCFPGTSSFHSSLLHSQTWGYHKEDLSRDIVGPGWVSCGARERLLRSRQETWNSAVSCRGRKQNQVVGLAVCWSLDLKRSLAHVSAVQITSFPPFLRACTTHLLITGA